MPPRRTVSPYAWHILRTSLTYLAPILAFALVLIIPFNRSISGMVRHGFNFSLVAVGAILYLGYRLERSAGWWLSFLPVSLLFGMGLAGLWSNAFSEMQVVSGMLYFSDASQYYGDALRILSGFPYSSFSARHPLPTLFLAILLWITGKNLQLTLAMLIYFCALCVYLASREVYKTWGAFAASGFILIIFLFFRRFIGVPDSENLGLVLGCLAFAFFFRSSNRRDAIPLAGMLLLSLALAARPSAFLILPALLIWYIWGTPGTSRQKIKRFFLGTLILSSGFSLTYFSNALLAEPGSHMYSNLAYTLYGIAQGGKGWEQFLSDFPTYAKQPGVIAEQFAFKQAAQAFIDHPEIAFLGLLRSITGYFSLNDSSLFGFLCGGEITAFNQAASPMKQMLYMVIRLAALGLATLGLGSLWHNRKSPAASLKLIILLGWLLSLPLIPSSDAGMMRVFAATISFLAFLPAVGMAVLSHQCLRRFHRNSPVTSQVLIPKNHAERHFFAEKSLQAVRDGMAFFLVFALLIGPGLMRGLWTTQKKAPVGTACQPGETPAAIAIHRGGFIHLVSENIDQGVEFPDLRYADYQASLVQFHRKEAIEPLKSLPSGTILANTIDLAEGLSFWIVLPQSAQALAGKRMDICGRWHPGFQEIGLGFLMVEQLAGPK
jgi:hypothetical protein